MTGMLVRGGGWTVWRTGTTPNEQYAGVLSRWATAGKGKMPTFFRSSAQANRFLVYPLRSRCVSPGAGMTVAGRPIFQAGFSSVDCADLKHSMLTSLVMSSNPPGFTQYCVPVRVCSAPPALSNCLPTYCFRLAGVTFRASHTIRLGADRNRAHDGRSK